MGKVVKPDFIGKSSNEESELGEYIDLGEELEILGTQVIYDYIEELKKKLKTFGVGSNDIGLNINELKKTEKVGEEMINDVNELIDMNDGEIENGEFIKGVEQICEGYRSQLVSCLK